MKGRYIAIMMTRPLCIIIAQLGLACLLGSWSATFPWWPFQMIAANCVCFAILWKLTRRQDESLGDVYFHPFGADPVAGFLGRWLRPGDGGHPAIAALRDVGLFLGLLLVLGLPAIAVARLIESQLPSVVELSRYQPLPLWALWSVTLLLPLTMPLVEVPWYFGYFFPKLERVGIASHKRTAWLGALVITTAVYSAQHCLQPFVWNATFLALRAVMLLPLLLLIASIVRIAPRFMPYILVLHGLMALEVVARYWRSA